ncbi:MAG: hypothetical protein FWH34_01685 [Desulfovibrionaceae bacterium]|nr:hypothetical protein [Desulfovibrionaceae bacterium]
MNKQRTSYAAFMVSIVTLLASGCAGPTLIVLHNPETKQMAQCQGDPKLHSDPQEAAEACAQGYEKGGYVRVSSAK